MCGIAGQISLNNRPIQNLRRKLNCMSSLIQHRGPDGHGVWINNDNDAGLSHRRLAIIDLGEQSSQPMRADNNTIITFNGEIYNYKELQSNLSNKWQFKTNSDTETILAGYNIFAMDIVNHLRGMFSFAIWDEKNKELFCARDRFGIKPFYYCIVDNVFHFASEAKALLPFLKCIETNQNALAEYLTFQFAIGEKTLFDGIYQLLPGHSLKIANGHISIKKYWDVSFDINHDLDEKFVHDRIADIFEDSVAVHCNSDVPIGAYVSGGIDSSLIYKMAEKHTNFHGDAFHGRFVEYPGYDESHYAQKIIDNTDGRLHVVDITAEDFRNNIEKVIYHLDFPVAGPGSFPQYMVSKLAGEHVKVVLGGQGGDEIFGGYARYLIAYLEQCIKAAIEDNYKNGNFVVTLESIIPNMTILREYMPLIKQFWSKGLFEQMDKRYFQLVNRSADMTDEIHWEALNLEDVFNDFSQIFNNPENVQKEAYFDKMTHFDFKSLLPALLHVEDRMSMAHNVESRVPILDQKIVEFAATIPANYKFKNGNLKYLLKQVFSDQLPNDVVKRRDKMGFPVPLKEWFDNDLRDFSRDIFSTMGSRSRPFINTDNVLKNIGSETQFSRKTWGLMSLELWFQQFHDKADAWKKMPLNMTEENGELN